ncbi:MAG: cellulose biosynthesis protein BcsG [Burkholderiales bacterium]|nr:cellulose biosynthesis protein BcsG [Burkholderiales bacterium]
MNYWNLYFIAKLILFFGGFIDFHIAANLAFAVVLLPQLDKRMWRVLRQVVAVPCSLALLYYDSWLPPVRRVLSQASALEGFSAGYVIELLGRFVNLHVVAGMGVALVIWWVARRWLRITSFVFLAIVLAVPAWNLRNRTGYGAQTTIASNGAAAAQTAVTVSSGPASQAELQQALTTFYAQEYARSVSFAAPIDAGPSFDIILIHVCSLAWDDLRFVGEDQHPTLGKFDIVFRNFGSGASYSGPAAIRLLRGACGQRPHASLYTTAPAACFLYQDLAQAGFEPQYAMNHDGHFGDFIADVQQRGEMRATPMPIDDTPVYLKAFDNTPIRDDFAVLAKWWKARLASPSPQVALYYNTISLHDGNHYPGTGAGGSLGTYKPRVDKLLTDIDRFAQLVASSGRRAAIVLIPEHGAALRGDKTQVAGMREIPGPQISLVPVGVRLVNAPHGAGSPTYVEQPSSYVALAQLLANFVTRNPFTAQAGPAADYARDLPTTEFVAENEGMTVQRYRGRYYLLNKGEDWAEYQQ